MYGNIFIADCCLETSEETIRHDNRSRETH